MNKRILKKIFIYLVLVIIFVYFAVDGSFYLKDYFNYEETMKYQKTTLLVGAISSYLISLVTLICMIIIIKKNHYRNQFLK